MGVPLLPRRVIEDWVLQQLVRKRAGVVPADFRPPPLQPVGPTLAGASCGSSADGAVVADHVQIFYANDICDVGAGDFKTLYEEWLPDHGEVPFIQFNHPGVKKDQRPSTEPTHRNNDYGIDDYDQDFDALVAAAGQRTALIELIIGPAFAKPEDGTIHCPS